MSRLVLGVFPAVLVLLLGGAWLHPAQAQAQHPNSNHEPGQPSPQEKLKLDPYEYAVQVKQSGDFKQAADLLEPLAKEGRGYEIAQQQLGECYLALAAAATAKPEDAPQLRANGLHWIVEAAKGDLASAQKSLVRLYLTGDGIKPEPVEAGSWYLIWKRNPKRAQLGNGELDPDLLRRLNATLKDSDWQTAQARADAFSR